MLSCPNLNVPNSSRIGSSYITHKTALYQMAMGFGNIDNVWINSNFDTGQTGDHQHDAGPTNADSFIDIQNMILSKPSMRSFSPAITYLLISGLIISLLCGSYFKSLLYRGVFEHKLSDRPVNILLLVGAIIHHVTHLIAGVDIILVIGFDFSFADVLGTTYCSVELPVVLFGPAYLWVGGFGIATFRTLCMKCDRWANQPKWLLWLVLFGSLGLTAMITALFMIETHHERVAYNACIGQSEFAQSILIDFKRSQGMDGKTFFYNL